MQARQQACDEGGRAELEKMKLAQERRHAEAQQDKKEKEAMDAKAAALAATLGDLNKKLAGEDDQVSKDTTAASKHRLRASQATQAVDVSRTNMLQAKAQLDAVTAQLLAQLNAAKAKLLADERSEMVLTDQAETSDKREAQSRKIAAATRTTVQATKDALSCIGGGGGVGVRGGGKWQGHVLLQKCVGQNGGRSSGGGVVDSLVSGTNGMDRVSGGSDSGDGAGGPTRGGGEGGGGQDGPRGVV